MILHVLSTLRPPRSEKQSFNEDRPCPAAGVTSQGRTHCGLGTTRQEGFPASLPFRGEAVTGLDLSLPTGFPYDRFAITAKLSLRAEAE